MRPFSPIVALLVATFALVIAAIGVNPVRPKLETTPLLEGVYVTSSEIRGFTGTILELRDGAYRYWFYSDVGTNDSTMPETGTYAVEYGIVQLSNGDPWHVGNIGELGLLWRSDALEAWKQSERIYDYGILVRTEQAVPSLWWEIESPSIDIVKQALWRPTSNWRDPFIVGPQ